MLRVVICAFRLGVNSQSTARWRILLVLAVWPVAGGCHVPQKPGLGKVIHRTEAVSKRPYWLYLPPNHEDALGGESGQRRYPLVVSLHGMRPFDDYGAHIRQWQEEADRYRFIVCAPRLESCDVLQRFPIDDPTSGTLKSDEQAILAIISEVCRITNADARYVLATSFSSGGYIAHYMVNRHPEWFSCLAVFQSNFTARILDPRAPAYRQRYDRESTGPRRNRRRSP